MCLKLCKFLNDGKNEYIEWQKKGERIIHNRVSREKKKNGMERKLCNTVNSVMQWLEI